MTTRREIIQDVDILKKKTKILEEKVKENAHHIVTHIHPTECGGWTGTPALTTTATNTSAIYMSTYTTTA